MSVLVGALLGSMGGGGSAPATSQGNGGGGSPPIAINDLLGQLDGLFDSIKCWGSSWTPQKAKGVLNRIVPAMVSRFQALGATADENSQAEINSYILSYLRNYDDQRWWVNHTNSPGKCSVDSITVMYTEGDRALNTALDKFKADMLGRGYVVSIEPFTYDHKGAQLPAKRVKIKAKAVTEVLTAVGGGSINKVVGGALALGALGFGVYKFSSDDKPKKKKKKK